MRGIADTSAENVLSYGGTTKLSESNNLSVYDFIMTITTSLHQPILGAAAKISQLIIHLYYKLKSQIFRKQLALLLTVGESVLNGRHNLN